ncbi:MAG: LapA family protein [Gammaproteobacteria bacterium]|nr:LapA family protein [Gammaproteobacteria bacterium]
MSPKLILMLVLVSLVAVFIVQNTTVVEVRLLLWTVAMSRALLILGVLIVGMLLGAFLYSHIVRRRRM